MLDHDDTEGWLKRQQALRRRWRAEDATAAKEINAVACVSSHHCSLFSPLMPLQAWPIANAADYSRLVMPAAGG